MTRSEVSAMIDRMDALQAQESAKLASAMTVPHLTADAQRSWWDAITARMRQGAEQAASAAQSLFLFNGAPISMSSLKEKLSQALGGGFRAD